MATLQTLPEMATLLPAGGSAHAGNLAARSFLYAVFKHLRLVIGVFLLVFLASALAALVRPSGWRATSRVLVKLGDTVQLAPTEAPSKTFNLPLTQEVVNTEGEIVKSRLVLEEAVARLGVQPEPGVSIDEMIAGMQLALTVLPTPSSNVLQISYVGRTAERAARMVNTITEVYLDHHNRVYRNEGVHDFYTEQLRILERRMKESQHRMHDFLRRENIVDVDQEIRILNQDVVDQDKTLKTHRSKIKAAEDKIVALRDQMDHTPAQIPFSEEYLYNPTLQAFKNKLTELEVARYQLLQQYMPTDRHVQDKDEEIANLQARIAMEKDRILNKQTVQSNELYREMQKDLSNLEVSLVEFKAREPMLAARVDATQKRLIALRDKRFVLANLKQDADETAYAFDMYRKKQDEARLTEAMKNQAMVNVSVVELASAPLEPVNGLLLPLLLGVLCGLGLATAMAVAVEYLNRRLRFEEEVERYLDLPVLAVIPDMETAPAVAKG